jgi:hypothetical protein
VTVIVVQAEKDAKQKARTKELKKLRKAREKKAQAEAAQAEKEKPISKVVSFTNPNLYNLISV